MEGIKIEVSIAKDFSLTPGPRNIVEGEHSGEKFRKEILNKKLIEAVEKDSKLVVNLDGTFGYGTSFLEETFGGLVRENRTIKVSDYVEIISDEEPYLVDDINKYIRDAEGGRK